jgi:hypothetical protein
MYVNMCFILLSILIMNKKAPPRGEAALRERGYLMRCDLAFNHISSLILLF